MGDAAAGVSELYSVAPPKSDTDISLTPVIVSNHTCYMDGGILACVFGAPRVVAMKSSRKVPIVGKFMEDMDVIFVDRERENSRQATLEAISKHCSEWTPGERPLLIFPEGTTTNGEVLKDFKKGAFVAGVPVRPVLMVYTGQWDPASTTYKETRDGQLVEQSIVEWGSQFFGHFVHSLHVRVLAPYFPSSAEKADPELYARNVQEYMASNLERVRADLRQRSWKEAAGRRHGGLNFEFGDLSRIMSRRISSCISRNKSDFD